MATINGNTLVMAIQAVDFKMADLERILDASADTDDNMADLEDLLLSYSKAAEALKQAYQQALTEAVNLPPYDKLVRGD